MLLSSSVKAVRLQVEKAKDLAGMMQVIVPAVLIKQERKVEEIEKNQ